MAIVTGEDKVIYECPHGCKVEVLQQTYADGGWQIGEPIAANVGSIHVTIDGKDAEPVANESW